MMKTVEKERVLSRDEFVNALYCAFTRAGVRTLFNTYCKRTNRHFTNEMSEVVEGLNTERSLSVYGVLPDGTKISIHDGYIADSFAREYHFSVIVDDIAVIFAESTTNIDSDMWCYPQIISDDGYAFYGRHPLMPDFAEVV